MKVNVSVHGRWHAFELANGLHRRNALARLVTTYPRLVVRRFVDADVRLATRPVLELRRRLYDRWHFGAKPDLAIARAFGEFAARAATGDGADLLVGWSAGLLEAITPAHSAGMKVVVVRGSTHIRNQMRILSEAYAEFGLTYAGTDPEIIARELAEYDAADAIDVPSEYAARTFEAEGVAREKLMVNPLGVDLERFTPATERQPNRLIRVLFVGRVGIQKGVPWLIQAVAKLGLGVELHLVGPVDPEAAIFLAGRGANVFVRGAVPFAGLPAAYTAADIFCLPSLQEGGIPLALLQAMASGLPCVVTPAARGPVNTGDEGIVVPPRDHAGLAAGLERLIGSADLRRAMGEAARRAVAAGYGWDDYVERAVAAYRALAA